VVPNEAVVELEPASKPTETLEAPPSLDPARRRLHLVYAFGLQAAEKLRMQKLEADFESDRRNPRKSGLEGVVLEQNLHKTTLIASVVLAVPFVAWLYTQGNMSANIVLTGVVFMVLAYSVPYLRFKERPVLDSMTSAAHFAGPFLYSLVLVGWQTDYLPLVLSFFLCGMASHAFGAVQDVIPDREAGIASIGTFLGARTTVRLSVFLYFCASALLLVQGGLSTAIVGALGFSYIYSVVPYWDITDNSSAKANKGWKRFMTINYFVGFVITLLLIQNYLIN
jgi:4-hydroxybenzoate polyprenyltransferase